jgi:hypothetical protein
MAKIRPVCAVLRLSRANQPPTLIWTKHLPSSRYVLLPYKKLKLRPIGEVGSFGQFFHILNLEETHSKINNHSHYCNIVVSAWYTVFGNIEFSFSIGKCWDSTGIAEPWFLCKMYFVKHFGVWRIKYENMHCPTPCKIAFQTDINCGNVRTNHMIIKYETPRF